MLYLFNNVSDSRRKKLNHEIHIIDKEFSKGNTIFNEGDLCDSICFIKKGRVISKNIFDESHEIFMRSLKRSESFGEGLIFSKNPYYKGTFIAAEDTELSILSKNDLIHLMELCNQVSINLFEHLNTQSVKLMSHIKLLSLKKVSSKVASYFYVKYKELGKSFSLDLNKTEIAEYLNVERPTFSKELNYLIKENIISYSHKSYEILDIDKLISRI